MSFLSKLSGIFLILFGIFMVKYFPGAGDYQPKNMSWAGIIIGIISLLFGVYLVAN